MFSLAKPDMADLIKEWMNGFDTGILALAACLLTVVCLVHWTLHLIFFDILLATFGSSL